MNQEILNCPNCGATIKHRYNHECPYCHTMLDFNIKQTEKINPRYMYDVEVRDYEIDPRTDNVIIYFKGKYLKASEALEYTNNNQIMVVDVDCMTPKEVFYALRIPRKSFQEFRYTHSLEPIINVLPFELDPHELIKALYKWGRW